MSFDERPVSYCSLAHDHGHPSARECLQQLGIDVD